MSLSAMLEQRVAETPDATAIHDVQGQLSFAGLHRASEGMATLLEERFGSIVGERILLWMGNDDAVNFVSVLNAVFAHGAIAVALDDRSTVHETRRIIAETEPRAIALSGKVLDYLGDEGLEDLGLEELGGEQPPGLVYLIPIENGAIAGQPQTWSATSAEQHGGFVSVAKPSHDAAIFYSSGSTGRPKGAAWTHQGLAQYAERAAHGIYADPREGKPLTPDDVLQSPIPLYTAASLMENVVASVFAGCALVFEGRRFDPTASEQRMHEFETTIYNGAPPHFAMMCDLPESPAPPRLEMMVCGGSAFTPPLYRRMRERWPGVSIANWYGLLESGVGQTLNHGSDIEREPGSIGRPVWPTEFRIVDDKYQDVATLVEGELWTRAPAQIREYYRNPEQTAKRLHESWLKTGDWARLDEDGLIHLVGRNEERINRGGFKFYPVEIESVLEEDQRVREAAVIAVSHPVLGQDVVAFVVPASGESLDEEVLRQYCRSRVAPNKVPSRIIVKDMLPRGSYGKVVRRVLAQEYAEIHAD
jgi:acyl-CoA synthetase (AMP-forming)/AMP-acid ligase II